MYNKIFLSLLLVLFSYGEVYSQRIYKQSISGQLFGPGLVGIPLINNETSFFGGGVRYDRLFQSDENTFIGFAVDVNGRAFWEAGGIFVGPDLVISKGRTQHFFEFEIGPRILLYSTGKILGLNLNLGYRFEAEKYPFFFKVGTGYSNWLYLTAGLPLKSGTKEIKKESPPPQLVKRLDFAFGFNLITPLEYYFGNNRTFMSASDNQCLSFHFELSRGNFSLVIPMRIPIMQLTIEDMRDENFDPLAPVNEYDRDAYNSPYIKNGWGKFNCKYELGIKPRYYLKKQGNKVRAFVEAGVYYGQYSQFHSELHKVYYLDTNISHVLYRGLNTELWHGELSPGPTNNFFRFSLGTGTKIKLTNKLSLDLEIEFVRIYREISQTFYTNWDSTDGQMREFNSSPSSDGLRLQYGINLNYHFLE